MRVSQPGLEYIGREFVKFDDASYRWVDRKRFQLPRGVSAPDDALGLLLGHVRYRDHYASGDSHERPTDNIHGPYRLDQINLASFEVVSEAAALKTIDGFTADREGISANVIADLKQAVYSAVQGMPVRYRLRQLEPGAVHEWGWVLRSFHELVLVDLPARELVLLVAGID